VHHVLTSAITNDSISSIFQWFIRSVRGLGVVFILGWLLLKRGFEWHHLLEMVILLALGVWVLPTVLPGKLSSVVTTQIAAGGTAGNTGATWGLLAFLVGLAAATVFAFK
jgi:hypothetical protein